MSAKCLYRKRQTSRQGMNGFPKNLRLVKSLLQNRLSSFTGSLSEIKIIFNWYHFLARIFLLYSTQVKTAFHAP